MGEKICSLCSIESVSIVICGRVRVLRFYDTESRSTE